LSAQLTADVHDNDVVFEARTGHGEDLAIEVFAADFEGGAFAFQPVLEALGRAWVAETWNRLR